VSWWKKLVWRGAEDAPSRRRTAEAPVARAEAPGGEVGPADAVLAGVVVALIALATAVFASVPGMNRWPPKPGLTVITRT